MLVKAQIKYIQSLRQGKYRHRHRAYVIEGEKIADEYIQQDYPLLNIYAVESWIAQNESLLRNKGLSATPVSERELKQLSSLTTPNKVLAVAKLPSAWRIFNLNKGLHLALESIRDPGNLGTIIRTADWFAIDSIICSEDCADAWSPKVVQAAMGSLARVKILYTAIPSLNINLPVYAATLSGKNIFHEKLPADAIILIGNESKGLSESALALATHPISIPRLGRAESLNAALAAGIVMAMFRRRQATAYIANY